MKIWKLHILCFVLGLISGIFATSAFPNEIEDKIVLKAIIDVKVLKVDSFELMSPDEILNFAYSSGAEHNLGETLRAITFLESGMGTDSRVGDNGIARGITQIQVPTAKFILKKLMNIEQKFTDTEIKMLVTYNDKMSIIMSKYYLVYLMDKFKNKNSNWSHGLLSYNRGPGKVRKDGLTKDPNNYIIKAKKFIIKQRES